MKKIFIISIIISCLLQSCYTYKATSSSSTKQNNEVVKVNNPHYVKRKNVIGVSFTGLSVAGMGYAGYKLAPIENHNGQEQKKNDVGNVGLGLLVGVGVNLLADKIFGVNTIKDVKTDYDFNKWVKKTNDNYVSLTGFRAIPNNQDSNYQVYSINDVLEYKLAFPNTNSVNSNELLKKANRILEQEDLKTVIDLYPENSEISSLKLKYIVTSRTFDELKFRKKEYNNISFDYENLSYKLIKNYNQLVEFNSNFPKSNHLKDAILFSFNEEYPNQITDEYKNIIDSFSKNELSKLSYSQKENFLKFVLNNSKTNSIAELESLIDNYSNLITTNSEKMVLDLYWNKLNNLSIQGDYLLFKIRQLGVSENYSNWNIKKSTVENFLKIKLDNIIKSNVIISNVNYVSASNENFETWKKAEMTAGIINNEGAGKYIIYGTITNNSPYTLPIKINATGNLDVKYKIEGQDAIGKGLTFLAKLGASISGQSGDPTVQIKRIGSLEDSFYFQNLDNNTYSWAILLDFSPYAKQVGINLFDSVKSYTEFIFNNISTNTEFWTATNLTSELINKQTEWQQYSKYGLPNNQLMDYWRKNEVSQQYWENELELKKERERILREIQRKQEDFNSKNSLVINSENSNYKLTVFQEEDKKSTIQIYTKDNDDYNGNYSANVYNKDGKLVKSFNNFKGSKNSRSDNYFTINEFDFPVTVKVEYVHKEKDIVSFTVALARGAEIEVLPQK